MKLDDDLDTLDLLPAPLECPACAGQGVMLVPQTYLGCPCCRGREKERNCRKCHGKGYL